MTLPGMARLIVEVGFSGPTTGAYLHLDDASRGRLDTARLGPDDLWADVSDQVVSARWRHGATTAAGATLRYEAGTATIVLKDPDRRFDPANLSGPYVVAGVSQVEPMRAVRLRAEWIDPQTGVVATYPLWRGFSDDWVAVATGPTTVNVTLTCKDGMAVFAAQDRDPSVAAGAGEDSGARVSRILDLAGWPASDRVIATGNSTLQATTLAGVALSELQLVADSEMGEFYLDTQGRATFRNRLALYSQTRSNTSQALFGDDSTSPTELPYEDIKVTNGAESIFNRISIARVGGVAQVSEDTASRDAYLTRIHRRTDLLLETDAAAADYSDALLNRLAQPEQKFTSLVVNLRADPRLWDKVLGRELGDRITAVRRPPGGGAPIQRDSYIRGIEHEHRADLSWTVTFVLQSAVRGQVFVLDHPILGQLDHSALAY